MPFTVNDFQDLARLLREHPEWSAELRRLVLTDELLALPELVRDLARTVERLAQGFASFRTETEVRLSRLEAAVAALVEAQRRGEERLSQVEVRLGRVEQHLGTRIEEDAEAVLREVLPAKGYELLREPQALDMNGEVDVAVPVRDRAGRTIWVLVEAKMRLRRGDVFEWLRRLRDPVFRKNLAAEGILGLLLPYVFGLRDYSDAVAVARDEALGVLSLQGEQTEPAALA